MSETWLRSVSTARYLIARGKGLGLPLTEREIEVVLAVMEGHTTAKELSRAVGIAQPTVNNYLYQIYGKSGARNLAQVVLMMTGVMDCPEALQPIQRQWRRKHYKIDE